MDESEELLIKKYIGQDEELSKYVKDHERIESDIEEYNRRIYLTPEEELEKKNLQKKKLLGKEKIFKILTKYRDG